LREKYPENRCEWGKSWLFGPGKVPAGRVRFFGSGTNAEKDRNSGNWRYTVASGKAKCEFRMKSGALIFPGSKGNLDVSHTIAETACSCSFL
jgi:hypothetical protein